MHDGHGGGKPGHPGGGVRLQAPEGFNALTKAWGQAGDGNQSRGFGGACYGDSGWAQLRHDRRATVALAATTITGDSQCYATQYRGTQLDTRSARTFLRDYVTLP